MRKFLLYPVLIFLSGCNLADALFPATSNSKSVKAKAFRKIRGTDGPLETDSAVLQQKIKIIYKKAKTENYSTQYALIADLGLHSGSKRMYLIDLPNKTIIQSGLVTHGSSTAYLPTGKRKYSNANGSLCSALGMYKIGVHYQGQFGLAYKLYGLNKENNNAYARAIVLHSHSCVPDKETTNPICQSWGCPTVSPVFLKTLSNYIDREERPILLYLFDSNL